MTVALALGSTAYDTSTLGGQVGSVSLDGTNAVTYVFFSTGTCTGSPAGTQDVNVSGGTAPKSSNHGPLGAGSYSFQATYNGNTNYNPVTGACEKLSDPAVQVRVPVPVSCTTSSVPVAELPETPAVEEVV